MTWGDTAYQLNQAGRRRREAEQLATSRNTSWRDRRYWRGQARHWTEQQQVLQQRWDRIGQPIVERLTDKLKAAHYDLSRLEFQRSQRDQWFRDHPDVTERLHHVERALELDRTQQQLARVRTIEGHEIGIEL